MLLPTDPASKQLESLTALVKQLRDKVSQLRAENARLRQQACELKCEAGYWKSRHADALKRNAKLHTELDQAKAEIRQLKAERFGKQSEKQSTADRSNELGNPLHQRAPKKQRGQQPGCPAPKRRDYSHLPLREQIVDLPDDAKFCNGCGKPMADLGYKNDGEQQKRRRATKTTASNKNDGEQLEIETQVYRRVVRRKRYRRTCQCRNEPRTITAPSPPKLLPKSLYGVSLSVHLLLEKFHLHRPTHRTIEQLRLLGLSLAPGTIADGFRCIRTNVAADLRSHSGTSCAVNVLPGG